MTAEAKELYNYIMGRETIVKLIENYKNDKNILANVKVLVDAESIIYGFQYCSDRENPFSLNDRAEVTTRIIREITNFDEDKFEECKSKLTENGISEHDVFEPYEVVPRKSNSYLEVCGLFVQAWKFVQKHTGCPFETFDELFNNVSGEREIGRFDCMEKYWTYSPDYYVGAFVLSGALAWAEIWSKEKDRVIAYVRMETI